MPYRSCTTCVSARRGLIHRFTRSPCAALLAPPAWRPSCDEAELSIYNKLKAKGIPNLPDIICAGDIRDGDTFQTTLNDTVASERNHARARPNKPIRGMVHHRIVSRLLIPLTSVRNAKELLLVGRDILTSKISSLIRAA